MTYKEKRLKEFDKKFLISPTYEEARDFIAESIDQALEAEKERVEKEFDEIESEWEKNIINNI